MYSMLPAHLWVCACVYNVTGAFNVMKEDEKKKDGMSKDDRSGQIEE